MSDKNIRQQLDRFTDGLVDNLINTPDEEILKEVEEEYGNPLYLANKARKILKKAQQEKKNIKLLEDM